MKKFLLATTVLAASAGFAAAEVTLSGDARMGVISQNSNDVAFTSRARVAFTLSGETDGGLAFGGSFRADNASGLNIQDANNDGVLDPSDSEEVSNGGAVQGRAGSVFISGSFGKLSMGDVDGAAQAAVGQVDGVGLTGLSDLNEVTYASDLGTFQDPSALYEYSTGGFTFFLGSSNPGESTLTRDIADDPATPEDESGTETITLGGDEALTVGAKYSMDNYSFGIGYERQDGAAAVGAGNRSGVNEQVILGASATFGGVTLKGIYGMIDGDNVDEGDQYAISATFAIQEVGVTVFYADDEDVGGASGYGIGGTYDLGGGASFVAGYARNETADTDSFDAGVSMSF